jgi:O-antigen/teichoic acid export membrane protein
VIGVATPTVPRAGASGPTATPSPAPASSPAPATSAGPAGASGLLADGAALSASAFLTACAGLAGWLIAARILPRADIGAASAFVNGFILIAALAEFGLGPALLRWLPVAGAQAKVLLRRAYLVCGTTAVLSTVAWLIIAGAPSDVSSPTGTAVLFVLAGIGWTLFQFQDSVLTGFGAARWVPLENLAFSVVRLVLLVVLGHRYGALGIVLSWLVPTLLGVAVVTSLLAVAAQARRGDDGVLPTRSEAVRLIAPVYPATVFGSVLYNVVPLLVDLRLGPGIGAVFFVVWMGLSALDLAATGFVNAVVIRLSAAGETTTGLLRDAAGKLALLFGPGTAVGVLVSGWLLGLFGPEYVRIGHSLLMLVLVAFLPRLVVLLLAGVHLAAGRGGRVAVLQGISAAGLVAVILLVPGRSLALVGTVMIALQLLLAVLGIVDLLRLLRKTERDRPAVAGNESA